MVVLEVWDPPSDLVVPPNFVLANFGDSADHPLQFPPETPLNQVLDHYRFRLAGLRYLGDAFPKWWPDFGPGIVAGFLGANVSYAPETSTVWFEPPQLVDIHGLHPAYDPVNAWWRRLQELTRAAVEYWDGRVCVGITDLGGNLDVLASLRNTQQLLCDVIDCPQEVDRLTREITRLWLRYYDELYAIVQPAGAGITPWAGLWSDRRCYILQSDFAAMISPQMFERFVMPDLAACCDALEHTFYHLDGPGELPHLDLLLSLERLRGIQWVPGEGAPPPEAWLPVLERLRAAGKLCQLDISPQGALTVVRALGGRGFAFYIKHRLSLRAAEDFLQVLLTESNAIR